MGTLEKEYKLLFIGITDKYAGGTEGKTRIIIRMDDFVTALMVLKYLNKNLYLTLCKNIFKRS